MAPKRKDLTRNAGPAESRASHDAARPPATAPDSLFRLMIASAPFPAFMLERNRVAAANALAQPILAAFGSDATWGDAPLARVVQLASAGRPAQTRVAVRKAEDPMAPPNAFDVTVLPVGNFAFVTARDVTFDVNLGKALTQSRALYRDLIECSADFAFETDVSGAFSFVSPRGALGFAASALHGRLASGLIADASTGTFAAHHTQDHAIAHVRDASGNSRTLRITSRPVLDEFGTLSRVRGVARDVTAEHACLKELEALRALLAPQSLRTEPDEGAPC